MILALFLALRFGNFGLSALLLAGGKASSRLLVLVFSIVGNLALNLALDRTFGAFGAAWSTVMTELIVAGSLLYFNRARALYRPVAGSVVFVAIAAAVLVGLVAAAGITVASIGTGVLFLAGAAFLLLRRRSGRPVKTATVEAS
jgi:O-antigen/teichoic acid export membrane protein